MKILNFGSLNLDYTYHVDHFVQPGETISSLSRTIHCGGKGLNQSIALANAEADCYHAGAIGELDGLMLLRKLEAHNVNTKFVKQLKHVESGTAFIQVDNHGENCIVLYGGANQSITKEMVDETLAQFDENDYLLIQNEINELDYIITKAHEKGMTIFFNPSPMNEKIFALPLEYIDCFLVNEDEAIALAKKETDILDALSIQYPNAKVVMTLGKKGAYYRDKDETLFQESYHVQAVDTTAAGDTFTGFFIASIAANKPVDVALKLAARAASIAVTRHGAAPSIPTLNEL